MIAVSNEQITKVQAILQQLDFARPDENVENRRRAPRINVCVPLSAVPLGATNPTSVQIYSRNLSISGIGFVSRRLFKANERVAIQIIIKDFPGKLVLARITFGRYIAGGLYEMGAEFLECVKDNGQSSIPTHWRLSSSRVTPSPKTPASTPKAAKVKDAKVPPAKGEAIPVPDAKNSKIPDSEQRNSTSTNPA